MGRTCNLLLLCGLLVFAPAAPVAGLPVINEFMASNAATIADSDGDHSDWLELYNPGTTAFDLTGCYLSDDVENPLRWRFPAGSVPPQGFLLVWASGKDRHGPGGELHTNFAISAAGEPLLLTAADGLTRLDEVGPIALATDVSYGRLPDGGPSWFLFAAGTPGAPNAGGSLHLPPPAFSPSPGFFAPPLALAITAADPAVEVRYTLDGSEPTEASPLYAAPLTLHSRAGEPEVYALIPTNVRDPADHYGWRPPHRQVPKLHVVRARAFRPGHAPSRVTTGSYAVAADLADIGDYPLISLATAPENLFADDIGIYVPGDRYLPGDDASGNYFQRGEQWERPLHVEFFERGGARILAQDAGMRIHGGFSRRYPQKTLRLYARSAHGAARFAAAIFPDLPYAAYNRLLIRNAGNDWGLHGFKDLMIQTMVAGMGFDTQAGRPVVHFINGEYWGLANLRERYDQHYLVRRHGVAEELVALLVADAEVEVGLPQDRDDYLTLRAFVSTSDLSVSANLAHVEERLDLANFLAYNVAQIYSANYDWPGVNVRFWRLRTPAYVPGAPHGHDGRWRWLMYDVDWNSAFAAAEHNTLAHATTDGSPMYWNPPWSTALLRGLLQSPEVRDRFVNACADHLNSTFRPGRLRGLIDAFAALYAPGIAAWQDRWDIESDWMAGLQTLRSFADRRPEHLRAHIIEHFALDGTTTVTLDVNDPAWGRIRINDMVVDGLLPGLDDPGRPYPWTGTYFQGVPIAVTAVPEPGFQLLTWQGSAGGDGEQSVIPGAAPLRLTAVFGRSDTQPPQPADHASWPNPFAEVVTIGFDLPGAEAVRLDIFNARGQRVRALGTFPAGRQQVQWDGRDEHGGRCAAGVYFYRLSTARGAWTGKMVLVR